MKKNSVAPEVRQQAAERRRDEGRPPVKNAWAPVLAESGTDLRDIRVECEEHDPEYVWRLETMLENERARVASLKTMLVNQDATIGKQQGEIENLQEDNEWQEAEIESLQKDKVYLQEENERLEKDKVCLQQEIERLRDESAVAQENERLRAAAAKVTTLVEGLEVALLCPLSLGQMQDPVVSKYGHTYSREYIETWLKNNSKCPMTNQRLTKQQLAPNFALTTVLDAFNAYQPPVAAPAEEEKPAQ
jgi:hypothetical protein